MRANHFITSADGRIFVVAAVALSRRRRWRRRITLPVCASVWAWNAHSVNTRRTLLAWNADVVFAFTARPASSGVSAAVPNLLALPIYALLALCALLHGAAFALLRWRRRAALVSAQADSAAALLATVVELVATFVGNKIAPIVAATGGGKCVADFEESAFEDSKGHGYAHPETEIFMVSPSTAERTLTIAVVANRP